MEINKNTIQIEDSELFEKIAKFKTFENLFDITLGTYFREVLGEEYLKYGWELLDSLAKKKFPLFVDSKLFNSVIDNLERLNDNKTYGTYWTFSKNLLKAMKAHWDILNEEERVWFMRPVQDSTVGYVLAGGQYFRDLFNCFTTRDRLKEAYPSLYKTSYIAYNCLWEYSNLDMLRDGMQFDNVSGYLEEIELLKNKKNL